MSRFAVAVYDPCCNGKYIKALVRCRSMLDNYWRSPGAEAHVMSYRNPALKNCTRFQQICTWRSVTPPLPSLYHLLSYPPLPSPLLIFLLLLILRVHLLPFSMF